MDDLVLDQLMRAEKLLQEVVDQRNHSIDHNCEVAALYIRIAEILVLKRKTAHG